MKLIFGGSEARVAEYAAAQIVDRINNTRSTTKKPFVLGFPTGRTAYATYDSLVALYKAGRVSFRNVAIFHMGDYVGLPKDHPRCCGHVLHQRLLNHIDVSEANVHLFNGNAADPEFACRAYEDAIFDAGGIDLFLGTMGADGHVAFNEPWSSLGSRTRVKTLDNDAVRDLARVFAASGDSTKVPRSVLTVGVQTVLDAREIIVLAVGAQKALALKRCVEDSVNHMWTLSSLQLHPKATIVANDEATKDLQVKTVQFYQSIEKNAEANKSKTTTQIHPGYMAVPPPANARKTPELVPDSMLSRSLPDESKICGIEAQKKK